MLKIVGFSFYVRLMHAALLSKEIKISIPQKAGPVPPRVMPGAELQPAEEEISTPEARQAYIQGLSSLQRSQGKA